jgi:group II intron reverse transcriptase/maturase
MDWMWEAARRTRRDGATGVDGVTFGALEPELDTHLGQLIEAMHTGSYRAPPVRRVRIPKLGGGERPLGIPTTLDKILQRAVLMVLEPIFEEEFYDCSFGFRPGRSAHQAIDYLKECLWEVGGGYVLEADIVSFFDEMSHEHLRDFILQRVDDGVIARTIGKWLNAGVMDGGVYERSDKGSPQGGVISPLLANIYLHHVVDDWFHRDVLPRMRGKASMVRYADDFVMVFQNKQDAERVMEVLGKRLGRFGLRLHPTKTRLISFKWPRRFAKTRDRSESGTFDFLGFRFMWKLSRKGQWFISRTTSKSRFRRGLQRVKEYCRRNLHKPLRVQLHELGRVQRGHANYYGIVGNSQMVSDFQYQMLKIWRYWVSRRSARHSGSGSIPLTRFNDLVARFFPKISTIRAQSCPS